MTDQIISQLPPDDKLDPLYWQMRRENDAFLRRRQWYWRHQASGTLRSQKRREALELAAEGQAKAAALIQAHLGYRTYGTTKQCPFDLWVTDPGGRAARVEVKTSLFRDSPKGGRFQWDIRQNQRDIDCVICLAKNGRYWPYIIPMDRIKPRRNIAVWSPCPADYRGQWQIYLEAWDYLEQIIANARPRAWQLSLPMETNYG